MEVNYNMNIINDMINKYKIIKRRHKKGKSKMSKMKERNKQKRNEK